MVLSGALSSLYDEAKVIDLESAETLSGKDQKKLDAFRKNQPLYDSILVALQSTVSETKYMSPEAFQPVLIDALKGIDVDKKTIDTIIDGLSTMDKEAEIQKDKKGYIIYDKETKDVEIVRINEDIDDYMRRVIWPHIPDAKAFFEEDLSKKKPVIKTGAKITFTSHFYKYLKLAASEDLEKLFNELEESVSKRVARLFE